MSDSEHQVSGLRVRKLKWLCRRGMKELDVLLERFIANQEAAIGQGAWPELESLLALEDDRLWDCVLHPQSASTQFQKLLRSISHGIASAD